MLGGRDLVSSSPNVYIALKEAAVTEEGTQDARARKGNRRKQTQTMDGGKFHLTLWIFVFSSVRWKVGETGFKEFPPAFQDFALG